MTFIEKVVKDLTKDNETPLSHTVVVFPNRRAGLFFKHALMDQIKKPVWGPSVLSIQEFVQKTVPFLIPGELTLLMELYQTYRFLGANESFDNFFPWGQMLLKDFDEVDKYLINGDVIFRNLAEEKSLEAKFSLGEEQTEALKRFWRSVSSDAPGKFQQAFVDIWQANRLLYTNFKERLSQKGMAYEGMMYRYLAENPDSCDFGDWERFIFAGFNALSPSEKLFIQNFLKQDKGSIYWDIDRYYFEDHRQEAGYFLREQFKNDFQPPEEHWVENRLKTESKNVKVFGVPLNVGQAKALGNILEKQHENFDPQKTAIVLPDENLLFPLLNSLPDAFSEINVTMGYPLRNSPFFSLFESLIRLQLEAGGGSADKQYYFRTVLNVLLNPFIHSILPEKIDKRKKEILENNEIFISAKDLQNFEGDQEGFFEALFQPVEQVEEVFPYFRDVLAMLESQIVSEDDHSGPLEKEYLYHFYTYLNRLEAIINQYDIEFTLDTFQRLFRQVIQSGQIPFNGEPLKGLQIMGTLETRNLDFENVFILSANEGQMPPSNQSHSFIPFNIRKAFGLPTYEEEDGLFSYHFYRLLQRAKNVYIFYDTEMGSLQKGEKSRFLYQLENEWAVANPNLNWESYLLKAPLVNSPEKTIEIPKKSRVWQKLSEYLAKSPDEAQRGLSPSALITFISCPLQFYFRYIAGLEEEEEVTEEISPDKLGSIFHDAIANLYEIHLERFGEEVSEESLQGLESEIENALKKGFKNHFSEDLSHLQGRNLLIKSIISRQLQSVLKRDQGEAPFKLLMVEKGHYETHFPVEVQGESYYSRLKGVIDRLDEKDGVKRVLDYKTGYIHYNKSQNIADFFVNTKNKSALQLLWYGYVYHRNSSNNRLKLGIYPLKQINNPINFLFQGETLQDEHISEFEKGLADQLQTLFNPEIPFRQTDDLRICKKCPYNEICHRRE